MGWLGFLSKKPPAYNRDGDLKAQAYDETIAANPPIRGTYPVAGNGPSILEKFQKSHPHLREVHLNDASAPPPAVPRLLDRPSTAPATRPIGGEARPDSQSSTLAKPPLRGPPKKRHGPYKLPSKTSNERNGHILNNKSIYSAPSSTFTRNRNSSIISGDSGSTRGFVDLLDAQSFIKPANFYGRVKAIGIKDFGEDVADRNLPGNGFNLSSTQVQRSSGGDLALDVQSGDNDTGQPRSSRKRHTMVSNPQTKSCSSNLYNVFPRTVSLQSSCEAGGNNEIKSAKRAPRRKSLHSFVPPSFSDVPSDLGAKGGEADLDYFPDSLRERARAMTQGDAEDEKTQSSRKAHEIQGYERETDSDSSNHAHINSEQSPSVRVSQYQFAKDPSRRRAMSNISSFERPSKRNSLLGVEESIRRKRSYSSAKHHPGITPGVRDAFYELPPLQPVETYKLNSIRNRPNSKDELLHRGRNQSIASISANSIKHSGIMDTVPDRGGSIRRWSLTSETAGSTLSSNPFRPQSGHTTNTSVDLTPRLPLPKTIEMDQASFLQRDVRVETESHQPEIDDQESLYHEVDPDLSAGSSVDSGRRKHSIDDMTIDEDASSIDSFDGPLRPEGEFEKDLLFQGYGLEGSQLPGLPGLFDAVPPVIKPPPSERTKSFPAFNSSYHLAAFSSSSLKDEPPSRDYQYPTRSLQYMPRPRSSYLRMPAFNYTDSEDNDTSELEYDSENELNFDIPMTRSGRPRDHSYDGRRRRETTTELSRENNMEFPDVARVAALRRETKAKQRASSTSLRKAKGKGKAIGIYDPRLRLDDPSSYADAES